MIPVRLISFENLSPNKAVDFKVTIDLTKANLSDSIPSENTLLEVEKSILETIKANPIEDIDIVFQKDDANRKLKKLIVFDMDSTLIYQEVIELIAAQAGVEAEVTTITTAAMNGEIDFKESLARRVLLLKGIKSANLWEELKPQLQITKGASELCKVMSKTGCKLAVCSGGFLPLANYIKEQLNLDYAFANQLETEVDNQGVEILSGKTFGDIVDGAKKRDLLEQLAIENSIDLGASVAIGDGANDLLMMGKAGFGVAWNAKPKVQLEAPSCLNSDSLKDVLYIFGYNDLEIADLLM
ncbi:hypothetical protein CANARDRAFT_202375 [[Candida] arabinofermentans NRRL YB-2248]|uniref:phosphoserine phosphatase n=1 Tax=[Candida] arabinofermentans NRRL YB-2248 TaxID=983967 RepID=A0A1E4SW32_9ASCO|nr:hypothetical protein CANARDRAFT_202375 [[Candida] arabinofermentans NRRL YB-2248]